jgi:sugar transferase EpsL
MTSTFYRKYGKRLLDRLLVIPGIIIALPVLAILSVIVLIKLGRPVLFLQTRPGIYGKPFIIYKYRTMLNTTDEHGHLLPNEERLVPFGTWLRGTSLDELPGLFNVLKGEMSLVGPRPLLMEYLDKYTPEQRRRHDVKPGVTGWAQVNGRNEIMWDEKFKLDVWYVDNYSLWLDLKILFLTLLKVLKRQGVSPKDRIIVERFKGNTESINHK